MKKITQDEFLDMFPDTYFRFIPEAEGASGGAINVTRSKSKKDYNADGYGWFFTVNGFPQQEWTKGLLVEENLHSLNTFFVDIDYEKGISQELKKSLMQDAYMEAIESGKPEPTVVVETQKGMHMYWVLNSPIPTLDNKEIVEKYKAITDSLCDFYGGDISAKDPTRVLRVPYSKHWKQDPPFEVSIYNYTGNTYSFEDIEKAFPPKVESAKTRTVERGEFPKDLADRIEAIYPRIERPSSQALLKKDGTHIPAGSRNKSLHVAATIYRDAGKPIAEAFNYFTTYHGLEKERGRGVKAMRATIRSAYNSEYFYGPKNEFIAPHITEDERKEYSAAVKAAMKQKKEDDEMFFTEYEVHLLKLHPTLHIDRAGQFYEYEDGVYVRRSDNEMEAIVYNALAEDGLQKYATRSKVGDKLAALAALVIEKPFKPDQNANIVNIKNGLFDVEKRELLPHTHEYVSIMQSPITYDAEAKPARWIQFLEEITGGDMTQQILLQEFAGYCLTTETKYEKSLIILGPGGNGKGRYANMLRELVGRSNTSTLNLGTLNERFGLSGLYGKKLNIVDEMSGHYFESDNIKQIISGEPMSAEIKNKQERLEFRPAAKILFTVNDLPRLNDTSDGIYRRFIIMTFDQVFRDVEDKERNVKRSDIDLESKLMNELSGVFNWALEGLYQLRENKKFSITTKNMTQLEAYKRENSPLAEFLDQEYVKDAEAKMALQELYKEYTEYCGKNGYRPKTVNNVGKELSTMGFKKEIENRKTYILGIHSEFEAAYRSITSPIQIV